MSSVLNVPSKFVSMIDSDIHSSLYKFISKFWVIYRTTNSINANIMFSLREIQNCLRKIKDDKSNADHFMTVSVAAVDTIIQVVQNEYVGALSSFIGALNVSDTKNCFHNI